jgi:UDP-glucose 4-epimerase
MARVLVTGAAGFLGSHLCDALLERGWTVTGFDNLSQGQRSNLDGALGHARFSLIEGDIEDADRLRREAAQADAIVHLAAYKIPRYGARLKTLEINAQGTRNVLEAAKSTGAAVLFASTSDCYGKNPHIPFAEQGDSVFGPAHVARWAYAVSKSFGEHLCYGYREEHGLKVSMVRIFGSYGPRQHLSWWGGPQSVFIDLALEAKPLPIHGDGSQTRSFTYVTDTIAGLIAVLEADTSKKDGELFNIGSNEEVCIADLARLIWNLVRPGEKPLLDFVPYQAIANRAYEDVRRRVPDARKLMELGWAARVPLEQGLRETLRWQRSVPRQSA